MDTRFEFERDGCLLLRQVVPHRVLDPLIEQISRAIGQYADGLHAKGELEDTHADLPFETRLVAINRGAEARLRSWNNIAVCEGLYNLICYPAIVDALRPIPRTRLWLQWGLSSASQVAKQHIYRFPPGTRIASTMVSRANTPAS